MLFEETLLVEACTEPTGMERSLRAYLNDEIEQSIRLKFAEMGKEDLDHLCKGILTGFHWRIERGNEIPGHTEAVYEIPLSGRLSSEDPRLVNGCLQLSR